jgi:hypothetical protein
VLFHQLLAQRRGAGPVAVIAEACLAVNRETPSAPAIWVWRRFADQVKRS